MGSLFSKRQQGNVKCDGGNVPQGVPQEPYEIYDPNRYDDETVELLKLEFRDDPETFVLNQTLMSIMFFDDYQKEIGILANTVSERGRKANSELIKEHQKELLMPDAIFQSVNRWVKFRPSRGPKKGTMEPLVSQRMYVLHNTIEIEDKVNSANYSRIDKPCYHADIEESKEHKGFVKVNILGTAAGYSNGFKIGKRESMDSVYSSYRSKPIQFESKPSTSSEIFADDSGFNTESDYEYTRITAAKTPTKLQILDKDIYTDMGQLPSKCITPVKVKNKHLFDSDSDDDEDDDNSTRKKNPKQSELFLTNYYLNSAEFMYHFKDNVFPNYLGEILDFTKESINQATSISGAIYCDTIDDRDNIVQYEIIPAIAMPWPDEIAFEWTLRRRVTVLDRRRKKPIAYKWPTDKMIEEARKLNCVVVPKGFMPKKGENSKMTIEWDVGFPKAERYLEFRMSHAQTRLYLIIIALHKTFVEPKTQNHGLIVEHIRNFMFWECEANYKAWPEDRMGAKLKLVLQNLYECLSKRQLPHYFIRGKNLLENVPGKYIVTTLEIFNNILESPASHVIFALAHLKYASGKFYPETDFERLHDILTVDNVFSADVKQTIIAAAQIRNKEEAKRKNEHQSKQKKRDKEQYWNRRLLDQQRQAYTRKLMLKEEENKNLAIECKQSPNFKVSVKKRLEEDDVRQIQLLAFYVQHFLQIAKKCFRLSSTRQTLFYLKQAWYLTKVLEVIDPEGGLSFQGQIRHDEECCHKKRVAESKVPTTPKRNTSYTFPSSGTVQVKGKKINVVNLNKSYNSNGSAPTDEPKPSSTETTRRINENDRRVRVDVHVQERSRPQQNNSSDEFEMSACFASSAVNFDDSNDGELTSL